MKSYSDITSNNFTVICYSVLGWVKHKIILFTKFFIFSWKITYKLQNMDTNNNYLRLPVFFFISLLRTFEKKLSL